VRRSPEKGWTDFQEYGSAKWTFDGGAIVSSGGVGHVAIRHKQPDFKLLMKYRVQGDARVAVAVRAANPEIITAQNDYEILLAGGPNDTAVGSITGFPLSSPAVLSASGTNVVEVVAKGTRVSVMINGTTTTDLQVDRTSDGYIAFTFQPGADGRGKLAVYEIRRRWLHPGE
jgi:hypothetical protein